MMLVQLPHALVEREARQMLRHQICWVLRTENLSQLQLIGALHFLYPQATDIDVPQLPGTLALSNRECCG